LFDEIEKASDALWQLLLGILDKATLTLGDNRKVDFSRCMIFLTSNLGAKEMSELITGSIGFAPARGKRMLEDDEVVVFRSLKEYHLKQILELELGQVQNRIMRGTGEKFVFSCTEEAKKFLLDEGIDFKYGARHLKRAIERFLVYPISNLVATQQVSTGDLVIIDYDSDTGKLTFTKSEGGALIDPYRETYSDMFDDAEPERAVAAEASDGGLATAPLKAIEK
jgi:ATP-dependent Clp protease ATP-binding subunit ClpA